MDVQEELNVCLEKFKKSYLPVTIQMAKILEINLNNILLEGVSRNLIQDNMYYSVNLWKDRDPESKGLYNFIIEEVFGSVLDWKNKGTLDENWR